MNGGTTMNDEPETQTAFLPTVRCTPQLKRRLEQVAAGSVTRSLADHIRYAVEQYVLQEEEGVLFEGQPVVEQAG